jgi:hypothetical protein
MFLRSPGNYKKNLENRVEIQAFEIVQDRTLDSDDCEFCLWKNRNKQEVRASKMKLKKANKKRTVALTL